MSVHRDREEFVHALGGEGVPFNIAERVMSDARRFHALCETACNRELAKHEQRSMDRLERQMIALLWPYGISVSYQHDPRGAVVKLRLPSGKHNDFASEGYFCVPTEEEEEA